MGHLNALTSVIMCSVFWMEDARFPPATFRTMAGAVSARVTIISIARCRHWSSCEVIQGIREIPMQVKVVCRDGFGNEKSFEI